MLLKNPLTLMMISTMFFGRVVSAQQDTHFTMYRNHMSIFNPALTGTEERSFLNLSYKNQWQGVDQAPRTQAISFGTPLGSERVGLGFNVINDATFIEDQTSFFVTFSYRLSMSDNTQLYLGIQGGGNAFRINGTALDTMNDQGLVNDPILIDHGQFNPNVGVGLYLKTQKAFISMSAPKILNTERFVEEQGFYTAASDRVHIYFSAGRQFHISDDWTFTPYFLTRLVNNAPIFTSVNTAFNQKDLFELGLEYNLGSSMGGSLIFELGGMGIGYAYTRSIHNEINQNSIGSHELLLKFKLRSNGNRSNLANNTDDTSDDRFVGTKNKENNVISQRF